MNYLTPIRLVLLLGLSALIASCSSTPEHYYTVQDDAQAVVTVNLGAIVTKGGITSLEDMDLLKNIQAEVNNQSRAMGEMIKNAFENPTELGIDLRKEIILSVDPQNQTNSRVAVMLSSADKFETTLETLLKEVNQPYAPEVGEGYSYIFLEPMGFGVVWTSNVAVLVPKFKQSAEQFGAQAKSMVLAEEQDQLMSTKDFEAFAGKSGDIKFWGNAEALQNLPQMQARNLEGYNVHMMLTFNDDNLELVVDPVNTNGDPVELAYKAPSKAALSYINKEAPVVFSLGFSPETVLGTIAEDPAMNMVLVQVEQTMGMTSEELIGMIEGTVVVAVQDIRMEERTHIDYDYINGRIEEVESKEYMPSPKVILTFQLNDEKLFTEAMKNLPPDAIVPKGSYYAIGDWFMAEVSKTLILANDEDILTEAINGGGMEKGYTRAGNGAHAYVALNMDAYSKDLQDFIAKDGGKGLSTITQLADGVFESLEVNGDDDGMVLRMYTHDRQENVLKTLMDLADDKGQYIMMGM